MTATRAKAAFNEARRLGPAFVSRRLAGEFIYRDSEQLRRVTTYLRIAAGLEAPAAADALNARLGST